VHGTCKGANVACKRPPWLEAAAAIIAQAIAVPRHGRARIPALLLYVMPMLFITLTPYLSGYTRLQHATNNMLFNTWAPYLFGEQPSCTTTGHLAYNTQPGRWRNPARGKALSRAVLASERRLMITVNTHSTQNAACRMQARAHDSPIPVPGADVAVSPVPLHVFIAS
jgi:hypothetical protein